MYIACLVYIFTWLVWQVWQSLASLASWSTDWLYRIRILIYRYINSYVVIVG